MISCSSLKITACAMDRVVVKNSMLNGKVAVVELDKEPVSIFAMNALKTAFSMLHLIDL